MNLLSGIGFAKVGAVP